MAKKRQRVITPREQSRMVAALYSAGRWKASPGPEWTILLGGFVIKNKCA